MKRLLFLLMFNILPGQETWDLQKCLDYAMANHPLIKQASVNVQKSERQIAKDKGQLLPSVNAGINHSYSFGSTINPSSNQREALNVQYDQFVAQADWELINWRNYINISLSKINKETSIHREKLTQNNVRINVIKSFFDYQNAKSWLEVLQTQIDGMEEQVKRTEKEVEIGNRAKSDIYDIKANLGTLQEQWISAKNQRGLAKIYLLNALALNDDNVEFVMNHEEALLHPAVEREDFTQRLLEINPAYRAAVNEIKAREKAIDAAKSNYLPTLDAYYSWSTFYNKTLGTAQPVESFGNQWNQNKNHQISLGLNIPIFNKFQIKNQVEVTKLNLLYTNYDKELIVNDLKQSIEAIKVQYQNAEEKYRLLEKNFENQKLSFQKSEEKYREGLMDAYTFFAVRNAWLQANYNLISSRTELVQQQELIKIYENGF